MVVRLGFALATSIRPEVLVMDEWFMAGDVQFLAKARTRLEKIVRKAEILVLSSHSTNAVLEWCTRVIWMDHGRVRDDGPAADVMARYLGAQKRPAAA
jgi:lipopolysaccharide transport system ATP-binding protein